MWASTIISVLFAVLVFALGYREGKRRALAEIDEKAGWNEFVKAAREPGIRSGADQTV